MTKGELFDNILTEMERVWGESGFGRSLPIMVAKRAGQIRCNRWSERMQMTGHIESKRMVKWSAISQSASSAESAVLGKAFMRAGEALGFDDAELSAVLDEHVSTLQLLRHGRELLQPSTERGSGLCFSLSCISHYSPL